MSAKNYADCPQCKKNFADELQDKYAEIKAQYGKIPAEDYQQLVDDLKVWRSKEKTCYEEVLGEYYEHWFEDGRFKAHYRAVCSVCGFEHSMSPVDDRCELK